jgi:hypothetical protein
VPNTPAVPAEVDPERREELSEEEKMWLERTALELSARAQERRAALEAAPQGTLDTLLCAILEEGRGVPARWADAQDDPDRRADLIDALTEVLTSSSS